MIVLLVESKNSAASTASSNLAQTEADTQLAAAQAAAASAAGDSDAGIIGAIGGDVDDSDLSDFF